MSYADRTFLPRRRRAFKMRLPPTLFLRARKPCLFFLLRLLG